MQIGMMWFDCSKRPLAAKLVEAKAAYQAKYGTANVAYLNPKDAPQPAEAMPVTVKTLRCILPHHIWIGQE